MTAENLAAVARAFADPTRAQMMVALMDERVWRTPRELAQAAGVAASTATGHLHVLVGLGLLSERRLGRHRYVRLAGAHVAEVIEAVAALGNRPAAPVRGLRDASARTALARGRTCYDHLAGRLGVAITDALVHQDLLDEESLGLTAPGEQWLTEALETPFRPGRRTRARSCLDWTERRFHLAGAAGAHISAVFHRREWVRPVRHSRAVVLTPAGGDALRRLFGEQMVLDWPSG